MILGRRSTALGRFSQGHVYSTRFSSNSTKLNLDMQRKLKQLIQEKQHGWQNDDILPSGIPAPIPKIEYSPIQMQKSEEFGISPSLVDQFGRHHNYLRISLTERCNLRCVYCMPEEGVELTPDDKLLSSEEIVELARFFASQGVNKIRFTGGEPTVRRDLEDIVEKIGAIPGIQAMAMTTNGIVLSRKLPRLHAAGLSTINISLDTLKEDRFEKITRRKGHNKVLESIHNAINIGIPTVKVNCVVSRGMNDDEILDFVDLTKDLPVDVRFIEYMPFDGNQWKDSKLISYKEMKAIINTKYELVKELDSLNDTAKSWKVPSHKGKVSFITSMTENFCSSCNRIRLTADGNLKVCLFGPNEISLRDVLRTAKSSVNVPSSASAKYHEFINEKLIDAVSGAVSNKKKAHAGMYNIAQTKNRPMILIGGLHPVLQSRLYLLNSTLKYTYLHSSTNLVTSASLRYSTLSHIDEKTNAPTMVDVSEKEDTVRTAVARTKVILPAEIKTQLLGKNKSGDQEHMQVEIVTPKGPVFATAIIAATMAAKKTSDLIPFCHPLNLTSIKCKIQCEDSPTADEQLVVWIECEAKLKGKTGVEMEALTGCSVAALTIYDMCKALSHDILIAETRLLSKTGGKSGFVSKHGEKA